MDKIFEIRYDGENLEEISPLKPETANTTYFRAEKDDDIIKITDKIYLKAGKKGTTFVCVDILDDNDTRRYHIIEVSDDELVATYFADDIGNITCIDNTTNTAYNYYKNKEDEVFCDIDKNIGYFDITDVPPYEVSGNKAYSETKIEFPFNVALAGYSNMKMIFDGTVDNDELTSYSIKVYGEKI